MCALGATDVELANFFEVNVSTIYLWSVRHKDFSEAKRLGKDQSDDRVEQSLYKRAMGYEHDEVDIRTVSSGPGMAEIATGRAIQPIRFGPWRSVWTHTAMTRGRSGRRGWSSGCADLTFEDCQTDASAIRWLPPQLQD